MTAKIKLNAASGGGSISIQAPSSSSNNRVISLPDIADGTLVTSQSTLDATKLSGALPAISGAALTNLPGGGKILQVKQTTKSNTFETNSSTYVDIPDLSVSITPASTSNKILFISSVNFGANQTGQHNFYQVKRDSTTISSTAQSIRSSDTSVVHSYTSIILDSPSSTSALTYKIQVRPENTNSAVGVNRNIGNTLYGFSTILCLEVGP